VRVVADFRDRDGSIVPGLEVRARFIHPFDRDFDREAPLVSDGGSYEGFAGTLRPGRWNLSVEAKLNGARKFLSDNKLVLSETSD
jgi:nitrogen fixation protein FixH